LVIGRTEGKKGWKKRDKTREDQIRRKERRERKKGINNKWI
jgi:hypothetical protein